MVGGIADFVVPMEGPGGGDEIALALWMRLAVAQEDGLKRSLTGPFSGRKDLHFLNF